MNSTARLLMSPVVKMTCAVVLLTGVIIESTAQAAVFSKTRYVKIDHEAHSAYVYDENFNMLPENPYVPGTSIEFLPNQQALWFLGSKVDVVTRDSAGAVNVESHNPRYYEMNHHVVWIYHSENREVTDQCGYNSPLAAGSELTDLRMPSGYAYKMDGGVVFPANWHWSNPAHVPHSEDVYLRFVMQFDDSENAYKDVNVTWVDTVPCHSDFTVQPGKSKIEGPMYPADREARIVAVYPHVHDHSKKIELQLNGEELREFKPEHANIAVAHDDVGEGETPLHSHPNHLPTEGLSVWTPGIHGPLVHTGDQLNAKAKFNNPHDKSIDNMVLFLVFWEDLSATAP